MLLPLGVLHLLDRRLLLLVLRGRAQARHVRVVGAGGGLAGAGEGRARVGVGGARGQHGADCRKEGRNGETNRLDSNEAHVRVVCVFFNILLAGAGEGLAHIVVSGARGQLRPD